jgi:hypothetical protein
MKKIWSETMRRIKLSRFNPLIRALSVIVLVLLVIGLYRTYKFIWPTPYVAKQAGFQIVFPGVPTVDKLPSQTKSGVKVTSGMLYNVDNRTKGTDHAVEVTSYAHVNFDSYSKSSKTGILESEIETIAKNDQLKLTTGQSITFKALPAVEATLAPSNPSEPSTHVIAFLNGNRLYILLGAGISSSQFNSYVKTFRLVS